MKRLSAVILVSAALALAASPLLAETAAVQRAGVVKKGTTAVSYSAELPIVTRVQGTAFFRTSIDISNNLTGQSILATFQYTYTRTSDGGFFTTVPQQITLPPLDNFHEDDIVDYLGTVPAAQLMPGAATSSFGTFLVTFDNLPSNAGWEGTVTARTYSPDPSGVGTNGIAYPGSLFFESANQTLVGTIHDTLPAPTIAGALRTNIGIRNTDINNTKNPVTVDLSFWDPVTGTQVGNTLQLPNLRPGEVQQINNVFSANEANIPSTISTVIVFADVHLPTVSSPTIEGYINILDDDTKDGSFFEMKCADTDGCGN